MSKIKVNEGFFHWFAGFVAGEGSFVIHVRTDNRNSKTYCYCSLAVGLRSDDLPVLEEIQTRLGIGRIYQYITRSQDGTECPLAIWTVTRVNDNLHLLKILDNYPLRSKKQGEYEIWREAVFEVNRGRSPGGAAPKTYNIEHLKYLRDKLKKLRVRDIGVRNDQNENCV